MISISYRDSERNMQLTGPKHDFSLLLKHFKYGEEGNPIQFTLIHDFSAVHTNSAGNQEVIPKTDASKAAIKDAVQRVMMTIPAESNVLFYFGGHGNEEYGHQSIIAGDEKHISGSELKSWLSTTPHGGVSVTAVFDACSSGGSLGLPYNYETTSKGTVKTRKGLWKRKSIPMLQISAARPGQVAYSQEYNGGYHGQLTRDFVQYLNTTVDHTIESLVSYLYQNCDPSGTQLPQVSSS